MEIKRAGSQPSGKGPAEYFTGTVRVDPLFEAPAPARVSGASVTFEPGARTAWHTHPLGQTLIVTAGCGLVQSWGGPIRKIRPGDVVWCPPGEKHWHGATATTAMTHIAVVEQLDGKAIVPIPGTTKLHRLEENLAAASVELTPDDLRDIDSASSHIRVEGARYPERLEQMTGR
jgi:quercetin dioxygenase-like cupin family protein